MNKPDSKITCTCTICGTQVRVKPCEAAGRKYCSIKCRRIGVRKPSLILTCQVCSKQFEIKKDKSRKKSQRYCSYECTYAARNRGDFVCRERHDVPLTCTVCKCTYYVNLYKKATSKYCSRECRVKPSTPIICLTCGKTTYAKPHQIKTKKFCSRTCCSLHTKKNMLHKETSIERKVAEMLTQLNIPFEKQKVIPEAKSIPDFYIAPNLLIYVDGKYWHSLPRVMAKDAFLNTKLPELGYKVLRLDEDLINKQPTDCAGQLSKFVSPSPTLIEATNSNTIIELVELV